MGEQSSTPSFPDTTALTRPRKLFLNKVYSSGLTSSYMGTTIIAPIYIRKRIRMSTDSSSHEFKSATDL